MAETLLEFATPVAGPDGIAYRARACAAPMEGGTWQGWIEFEPLEPGEETLRSPRETTQPNFKDTEYWATGLTAVYLEGALTRALNPVQIAPPSPLPRPKFEEPAPSSVARDGHDPAAVSILDPFSVYEKGEALLRKQLAALSAWHLVNIAVDYQLTNESRAMLNQLPAGALIDLIVRGVEEGRPVESARRGK